MVRQGLFLAGAVALAATASCASAQSLVIHGLNRIDETQVVTLEGNVHPLARADFDQGPVNPEMRLERMVLLLKLSPVQQTALDALVEEQQNPGSPLFHQWLTPAEYGAEFGVSEPEMAQVTAWLASQGLTVDEIPAGRQLVVFSGTAGQVFDTFRTEMHVYRVNGAEHIANSQDPQIPASLASVVSGVVSLHDFRRRSEMKTRRALGAQPQYTAGSTHYLLPSDFAAIYDLNPLYGEGTAGTGSAIAIAGRSNINLSDVAAFRSMAGLAASSPTVIVDGTDPGLVASDQDELTLDVEWSGAVAPDAAVNLVAAALTQTTDGVDLASQYIVNHATAPVVSVSYGSCEHEMGMAELEFYNSLWEQAASQGMSVFVASGDAGAAGCEAGADTAGSGNAVNGMCSSPYATCVGGTEFNEGANPAQYWVDGKFGGVRIGGELHSRGSVERERVERRDRAVGVGRGREHGVRAANVASGGEWSRRGEGDEGSAGCGAFGRGPRRLFHGGERIELDRLGDLGGVACVCGRDGAGGGRARRRRAGQRQCATLCNGGRGWRSIPRYAFGQQQRSGSDGVYGGWRGVQPGHGAGIGGRRIAGEWLGREVEPG